MELQEAVTVYLAERRRNKTLRADSLRTIRYQLWGFADFMGSVDVRAVNRMDVARWLSHKDQAARTIRNKHSAVAGLYRWLRVVEEVEKDPTFGIDLPRPPDTLPRAFVRPDVALIFDACKDSREAAIVSLMVQEGLRAGEVARLDVPDANLKERIVGPIKGKGGKEREVPMTQGTKRALLVYLNDCPVTAAGPLIRSFVSGGRLNPGRVSVLMSEVMYRAGVKHRPRDGASGHGLRHTAASDILESTHGGIKEVQEFLGHSSIATTQIYLRKTSAARLRKAVEGRDYRVAG